MESFSIPALLTAYRTGECTPLETVEEVIRRCDAYEARDPAVWISRVEADALRARAAALAADPGAKELPLYGIPFAVKDNIDVAGLPTTAACPSYAYEPARSATVVARLEAAGALCIGKTNLDQFATGLVGTRSPYGAPRCVFDKDYISGGSSSGSAVAVAAGLVSFSLGTDTAGSGRVPAAFNNLVGVKPTRGLVSAAGVVPACRSLDCVSIFTQTVEEADAVLAVAEGPDAADAWSRPRAAVPAAKPVSEAVIGVPSSASLEFFGDEETKRLFEESAERFAWLGARLCNVNYTPFAEAARLLYEAPFVAERFTAAGAFLKAGPADADPTVTQIILGAETLCAADLFKAQHRLQEIRAALAPLWDGIDALLLPTAPAQYKVAEVEANPVELNSRLGTYTNFLNLLDLAALAVPAGFAGAGLARGVTLVAPAFHEPQLMVLGAAHEAALAGKDVPAIANAETADSMELLVVGAHLSGLALNHQLMELGGSFLREVKTAPLYRFYALPDGKRPGLIKVEEGGVSVEGEVWRLPLSAIGLFLAGIAPPLGLGTVALADGSSCKGFICEGHVVTEAEDISSYGGWRAWIARTASTA